MATFTGILYEALLTPGMKAEKVPSGKKYILLMDIDDTMVVAKGIYILRKLPTDRQKVKLTPEQYSKEKVTPETKKYYDYSEFRDPKKVYNSIINGTPLWRNLRVMDHHIKNGWQIGILTARGMGDVINKAMQDWLKYKEVTGKGKIRTKEEINKLKPIGSLLKTGLVNAVGDMTKQYPGTTDFQRKAMIIMKLAKKYDMIKFLDDDSKNLKAVNDMNLRNVLVVKALPKETM